MSDMQMMLRDYRLTTAEITYFMPDHLHLLQTFVWQRLDLPPAFPRLQEFLDFWQRELHGPLHSVRVAHVGIIQPIKWNYTSCQLTLH